MNKFFIATIVIACVGWAVWPYYALYDLARGLDHKDPLTLERRIAWDEVRRGFRDDANAVLLAMIATDPSSKNFSDASLSSGLSAVFGPSIINQLVDAYMGPRTNAVQHLIRHGWFDNLAPSQDGATTNESEQIINWRNVEYAFFSGGPLAFVIEVRTADSKTTKQSITLLFKWSGDWKLTRIFLPSEAIAKIAFDRAKTANTIEAWNAFLNYFESGPLPLQARDERKKLEELKKSEDRIKTSAAESGLAKAVLYEEDQSDPQGIRFVGTAMWRAEMVSATPGAAPDMAARLDVTIPEKPGLNLRLTLMRNADKSLPASHTIEIKTGKDIGNVPGVLLKESEQARGVPLAGLAVKTVDGYFLIGLSQVKLDHQRNIELLKTRSWFDIPIVYANGLRAILAVEKGESGKVAFTKAFSYWDATALSPPTSGPSPSRYKKSTNISYRDSKIKRLTFCLECIDADQLSVVRQERSAGVSGVDRGLRLNDVRPVLDLGLGFPSITVANLADNSFSVRPCFSGGMTDRVDVCTNSYVLCMCQLYRFRSAGRKYDRS